jgi:nucleoside-diphosphate-sugar epimerase
MKKIIILGAGGFIGKALSNYLKIKKNLCLGKKNCNLKLKKSRKILKKIVKKNSTIIFISAIAPCKNLNDFNNNILMLGNFILSTNRNYIKKIIYLSSDAVYKDTKELINEESITEPSSLHGLMHLTREKILKNYYHNKLVIIRPTSVYGADDTHNSYGPNQFSRLAKNKKNIVLFGNGEEVRDHVYIDDLLSIINHALRSSSPKIYNAVSGQSLSFFNLAKKINRIFNNNKKIMKIPRKGPIPHLGHRCFSLKKIKKNYPNYKPTKLNNGLKHLLNI